MIRNAAEEGVIFDPVGPKYKLPPGWQNLPEFVDCRIGSATPWAARDRDRTIDSVRRYSRWLARQTQLVNVIDQLQGRTLVCDCRPQVCHCDVLQAAAWVRHHQRRSSTGTVSDICGQLDRGELPGWLSAYKPESGGMHLPPWILDAIGFCDTLIPFEAAA